MITATSTDTDAIPARLAAAEAGLDELEAAILAARGAGWDTHRIAEQLGTRGYHVDRWLRGRESRRRFAAALDDPAAPDILVEPSWP